MNEYSKIVSLIKSKVSNLRSWLASLVGGKDNNEQIHHDLEIRLQALNQKIEELEKKLDYTNGAHSVMCKKAIAKANEAYDLCETTKKEVADIAEEIKCLKGYLQKEETKRIHNMNEAPHADNAREVLYCAGTSDGNFLTVCSGKFDDCRRLFEIDKETGGFTIMKNAPQLQNAIVNRDYALCVCEIVGASDLPTRIEVVKKGKAVPSDNPDEWKVTSKLIIKLL